MITKLFKATVNKGAIFTSTAPESAWQPGSALTHSGSYIQRSPKLLAEFKGCGPGKGNGKVGEEGENGTEKEGRDRERWERRQGVLHPKEKSGIKNGIRSTTV